MSVVVEVRNNALQRGAGPKPILLRGSTLTFEKLMRLYKALTGREPTDEDIKTARATWDAAQAKKVQ
jgi:hypothetical protein